MKKETSLKSQKETQQPNQKPKIITPNKELIGVKKSEPKKEVTKAKVRVWNNFKFKKSN